LKYSYTSALHWLEEFWHLAFSVDPNNSQWFSFFFFYSNENNEPIHVHIEKGDASGKVWLEPITVEYLNGFSVRVEREIIAIINQNGSEFIKKRDEYFS
jgi:Domain of unknown function (DUF4160)